MSISKQPQTGFAELNGTRLYYEVAGEGHPLVLVHGGLVDRRLWNDQFDVFAQHYKVIRYDIRGFGDSGLVTADTQPYSLRGDLYALLQWLGIEKTYVLGLSMGGGMAIDFTLTYPEMVDALIPVAAGVSGFQSKAEDDPVSAARGAAIDEAFAQHDIPRAVEISLQMWTDGPGRSPEEVDSTVRERVRAMTTRNCNRPDDENASFPQKIEPPAITRLNEIHVPTLIIVGDQDIRDISIIADMLESGIAGAKKVIIPGTAHHLNMEKPQEFNQIVLDFLAGL